MTGWKKIILDVLLGHDLTWLQFITWFGNGLVIGSNKILYWFTLYCNDYADKHVDLLTLNYAHFTTYSESALRNLESLRSTQDWETAHTLATTTANISLSNSADVHSLFTEKAFAEKAANRVGEINNALDLLKNVKSYVEESIHTPAFSEAAVSEPASPTETVKHLEPKAKYLASVSNLRESVINLEAPNVITSLTQAQMDLLLREARDINAIETYAKQLEKIDETIAQWKAWKNQNIVRQATYQEIAYPKYKAIAIGITIGVTLIGFVSKLYTSGLIFA
jgi:hypothetical protein